MKRHAQVRRATYTYGVIPQDIQLNSLSELLLFSYQIGRFMTGIWLVALVIDLLSAIGGFLLARHLLNTQLNLE